MDLMMQLLHYTKESGYKLGGKQIDSAVLRSVLVSKEFDVFEASREIDNLMNTEPPPPPPPPTAV
jgi:hypothetical protein